MSEHQPVLPEPDLDNALATAGVLCHFIASHPAMAEVFARWVEHCPGDLDPADVSRYLSQVHDLLQPDCGIQATEDLQPPSRRRNA